LIIAYSVTGLSKW